jgi:hypothetical protein
MPRVDLPRHSLELEYAAYSVRLDVAIIKVLLALGARKLTNRACLDGSRVSR